MSTTKIKGRILAVILLVLALNLTISLLRFISMKKGMDDKLREEMEQLEVQQKKNYELKKKLEYVKSPLFLQEQAQKLLGSSVSGQQTAENKQSAPAVNQLMEPEIPNYQKWLKLFIY